VKPTAGWDAATAAEMYPVWQARHLLAGSLVDVDDLVRTVDHVVRLGGGATVTSVTVTPRTS